MSTDEGFVAHGKIEQGDAVGVFKDARSPGLGGEVTEAHQEPCMEEEPGDEPRQTAPTAT